MSVKVWMRSAGRWLLPMALLWVTTGCREPGAVKFSSPGTQRAHVQTAAPLRVEPDAGFGFVYDLIHGATQTIDMTMYELVDSTASQALVNACGRGVRVRVILDGGNERAANTPAYNQLSGAGPRCMVAWSNPQFPATHQKSLLVDGHSAVILTANLTRRYYAGTRDFAWVDNDHADLDAIEGTFNADFRSTSDRNYLPTKGDDLIWSPTTAQAALLGVIRSAKQSLVVENEELGAATIVSALEQACRHGVQVKLAMTDSNPANHANFAALQKAGCGVHVGANNASTLYLHAKAMVADAGTTQAQGYVGSINFSVPSMTANRELGAVLRDAGVLGTLATTIAKDYDSFPAYSAGVALSNNRPALP